MEEISRPNVCIENGLALILGSSALFNKLILIWNQIYAHFDLGPNGRSVMSKILIRNLNSTLEGR